MRSIHAFTAAALCAAVAFAPCVRAQSADASALPAAAPASLQAAPPVAADSAAVPVAAPATVAGPAQVRLQLDDILDSKTSVTGQRFGLTVVEDLVVDGQVVVPKGARARGTVLFARRKGAAGRSGALDLRVDEVETPSGTLRLKAALDRRGVYKSRDAVVMQAFFGVLGALATQSNDVSFQAGTLLTADVVGLPGTTPAPAATAPVATAASPLLIDASPAAAPPASGASAPSSSNAPEHP